MDVRKVFKKSNSVAVCIPAELARELQLKAGDSVAWVGNKIVKLEEVTK